MTPATGADGIALQAYLPARHAAALRDCLVELQDHEHALDRRAPRGEGIADEYLAWMFQRCDAHRGRVVMALAGEEVVGFMTLLLAVPRSDPDDPASSHALLTDLMVRQAWRGRGIGARLLAEAEQLAQAAGCGELRVTVFAENHGARRFYARAGYGNLLVSMRKGLPASA